MNDDFLTRKIIVFAFYFAKKTGLWRAFPVLIENFSLRKIKCYKNRNTN
jgi:hypothetical protein